MYTKSCLNVQSKQACSELCQACSARLDKLVFVMFVYILNCLPVKLFSLEVTNEKIAHFAYISNNDTFWVGVGRSGWSGELHNKA